VADVAGFLLRVTKTTITTIINIRATAPPTAPPMMAGSCADEELIPLSVVGSPAGEAIGGGVKLGGMTISTLSTVNSVPEEARTLPTMFVSKLERALLDWEANHAALADVKEIISASTTKISRATRFWRRSTQRTSEVNERDWRTASQMPSMMVEFGATLPNKRQSTLGFAEAGDDVGVATSTGTAIGSESATG
jgi:hypothetical protein